MFLGLKTLLKSIVTLKQEYVIKYVPKLLIMISHVRKVGYKEGKGLMLGTIHYTITKVLAIKKKYIPKSSPYAIAYLNIECSII